MPASTTAPNCSLRSGLDVEDYTSAYWTKHGAPRFYRYRITNDEPYLLAKGPGSENALLYLAVPPSLLNQAKGLPPLTRVLITARVRVGRSEPVGTPILDLKSISKR